MKDNPRVGEGDKLPKAMIDVMWKSIITRGDENNFKRVKKYLYNMLYGSITPANSKSRACFKYLFFPDLSEGPFFSAKFCAIDISMPEKIRIFEESNSAFLDKKIVKNHSDLAGSTINKDSWNCVYFRSEFEDFTDIMSRFPHTANFLNRNRVATEALFSRLLPNSYISNHSDRANYVTTIHIPLNRSTGFLTVGDKSIDYSELDPICFDSTFFHSVSNDTEKNRDILLFNIWHPELTDDEIWALKLIRSKWWTDVKFDPDKGFLY